MGSFVLPEPSQSVRIILNCHSQRKRDVRFCESKRDAMSLTHCKIGSLPTSKIDMSLFDIGTTKGKLVWATTAVASVFGVYFIARKKNKKPVNKKKFMTVVHAVCTQMEMQLYELSQQEKQIRMRVHSAR